MAAASYVVKASVSYCACIIRMAGACKVGDVSVILGMLVGVPDKRHERSSRGAVIEHTRHDAGQIGFLSVGGGCVLTGRTPCHELPELL